MCGGIRVEEYVEAEGRGMVRGGRRVASEDHDQT